MISQISTFSSPRMGKRNQEKKKPEPVGKVAKDVARSIAAEDRKRRSQPVYMKTIGDVSGVPCRFVCTFDLLALFLVSFAYWYALMFACLP